MILLAFIIMFYTFEESKIDILHYPLKNIVFIICIVLGGSISAQKYNLSFTDEEKAFMLQNPVIEFGYEPNWEPYEIYDKDKGEYSGIVGEYIKIIQRETGVILKPIPNLTWKNSIEGLKSGKIKMVPCCAITPERSKYLEFTEVYINDPLVIIVRNDYPYVGSLEDLEGKTIALPENYFTVELLTENHPGINISIKSGGIQECLEAVSYGEADAFIDNLGVVSFYMNHKGFSNLKVSAPTPYKNNGIALATTKDFVVFRNIAQKVFDAIPLAEHSKIRQQWISNDYGSGFFNQRLINLSIIFGVVLLLAIGIFYYWNKTLRKQIQLRKLSEKKLMDSLDEIKKQDNEKKILLQEIHHRVKNNLQIVSSMMRLQANVTKDHKSVKTLQEAVERIKTIALVHDKIYKSPDVSSVSITTYLEELAQDILLNYALETKVQTEIKGMELDLSLDNIVPLGLIINELITNSVKYAFENVAVPKITISLTKKKDNLMELVYADNGTWKVNPNSDYFGTSLIEIFTEQLEGKYELFKESDQTRYVFLFMCEC